MVLHNSPSPRKGATVVEFAVVCPAVLLILIGLLVFGMGIFRYGQLSHLAREGARFASTHGGQYILDGQPAKTGVSAISSSSDMQSYLNSKMIGLDASKLTVNVAWSAPISIVPNNIPSYVDTDPNLVPPGQKTIQNYVTVTLTYQWVPEVASFGSVQLTSTSTMPVTY